MEYILMPPLMVVYFLIYCLEWFFGKLEGLCRELLRLLEGKDRGYSCLLYTSPSPRDS